MINIRFSNAYNNDTMTPFVVKGKRSFMQAAAHTGHGYQVVAV